ncbi:hypothetical protein NC651_020119 [Populus alba x Populus x berolinensis]|nr:hypothetical protein NC651_020119 [Populus alba x Populus x berolinensis]
MTTVYRKIMSPHNAFLERQAREKRMFDTSFSFLFCVFISLRISSSIVTVTINNKIQDPLPLCGNKPNHLFSLTKTTLLTSSS